MARKRQPDSVRHVRIFVASPGDVDQERWLAREVIERLGKDPAFRDRLKVDPILWNDPEAPAPMLANLTPQESVTRGLVRPSDCDIVITIFWSRMGSPLEKPLRTDKTPFLSGTEWEFEDARRGKRDILLYRRVSKVQVDIDDPTLEEKRAQRNLVAQFFDRLKGARGGWKSGYTEYDKPEDFGRTLEANLRNLLTKLLAIPARAVGRQRATAQTDASSVDRPVEKDPYDKVTGAIRAPRRNGKVGRTITCSGVVSGMRRELSLWLAVEVGDRVWPKEAAVTPDRQGKWRATIFEDGATKTFAISLFAADGATDRRLRRWLESGRQAGSYGELRSLPGTRRLDRVDGLKLRAE
jgi:hypothetical protein